MATLFWCKVFKAPDLPGKHHIIGYEPLIDSRPIKDGKPVQEKNSLSPVHHMVLYECAEDHDKRQWNEWAQNSNDGFFGPNRPAELATCVTPIAAWAMGSKGQLIFSSTLCPYNRVRRGNLVLKHFVPINTLPLPTLCRILEALCVEWRNSTPCYCLTRAKI